MISDKFAEYFNKEFLPFFVEEVIRLNKNHSVEEICKELSGKENNTKSTNNTKSSTVKEVCCTPEEFEEKFSGTNHCNYVYSKGKDKGNVCSRSFPQEDFDAGKTRCALHVNAAANKDVSSIASKKKVSKEDRVKQSHDLLPKAVKSKLIGDGFSTTSSIKERLSSTNKSPPRPKIEEEESENESPVKDDSDNEEPAVPVKARSVSKSVSKHSDKDEEQVPVNLDKDSDDEEPVPTKSRSVSKSVSKSASKHSDNDEDEKPVSTKSRSVSKSVHNDSDNEEHVSTRSVHEDEKSDGQADEHTDEQAESENTEESVVQTPPPKKKLTLPNKNKKSSYEEFKENIPKDDDNLVIINVNSKSGSEYNWVLMNGKKEAVVISDEHYYGVYKSEEEFDEEATNKVSSAWKKLLKDLNENQVKFFEEEMSLTKGCFF